MVETTDKKKKSTDTLSSAIFAKMREDILDGHLKAGDKLKIDDLKARYHSGHSPIREALSRLLPAGLVERQDQKGFRVKTLTREDLAEITKMRCWLEDIAIRESIRLGDELWEEQIVVAHHRLSKEQRYPNKNNQTSNPVWEKCHEEFHASLLSACDSTWLSIYNQNLQRMTERYRRNDLKVNFRKRNAQDEHLKIFNAVINRNADLASKLLQEHHRSTSDSITTLLPA